MEIGGHVHLPAKAPANEHNLRIIRYNKGECPDCGNKTHKITVFRQRIPLTKPGLVDNGICLRPHDNLSWSGQGPAPQPSPRPNSETSPTRQRDQHRQRDQRDQRGQQTGPTTDHCSHCSGSASELCKCIYGCRATPTSKCIVIQSGIICDGCGESDFKGPRFDCHTCKRSGIVTSLCASCYKNGIHDLTHAFQRIDRVGASPIKLSPRRREGSDASTSPTYHTGVICDGCGNSRIQGVRYECSTCMEKGQEVDLCQVCYLKDEDHKTHSFVQVDVGGGPTPVPPRVTVAVPDSSRREVVTWTGVMCDGCKKTPINGPRFECASCNGEFDLCSTCYRDGNKHDKTHEFRQYQSIGASPISMPPREKPKPVSNENNTGEGEEKTYEELAEELRRIRENQSRKTADNSGASVHVGVLCDECGDGEIVGSRYECITCQEQGREYDLCERCYQKDRSHQTHSFFRYERVGASPQRLSPRKASSTVTGVEVEDTRTYEELAEEYRRIMSASGSKPATHCSHCPGNSGITCTCTAGCNATDATKCVVVHQGVHCDGNCGGGEIVGSRFECIDCQKLGRELDLCETCFGDNVNHDKGHTFLRYDRVGATPVRVKAGGQSRDTIDISAHEDESYDELYKKLQLIRAENERRSQRGG